MGVSQKWYIGAICCCWIHVIFIMGILVVWCKIRYVNVVKSGSFLCRMFEGFFVFVLILCKCRCPPLFLIEIFCNTYGLHSMKYLFQLYGPN